MMIKIKKYEASDEKNWEDLVGKCKNSAFVLSRKFLSYHGNRFQDYSVVFYNDNVLIAAIPAAATDNIWYAHPGLPFADLMMCERYNWFIVNQLIQLLINFLKEAGFQKIICKFMPPFYKKLISEEWLYYFRYFGAELHEQKLTAAIPLQLYDEIKKNVINESKQNKRPFLVVSANEKLKELYALMQGEMKQKYKSTPTHSLEDLQLLIRMFPENVHCLGGYENGLLKGGAILFIYDNVVKIQYLFSTEQYLADIIILYMIKKYQNTHTFIDLGTSNSLAGNELNYGNLQFKAKNGGKACIVESYRLVFDQIT